jgi:hypothetical protein
VSQTFNIYGHNARINTESIDNSTNVVTVAGDEFFARMRDVAGSITNQSDRDAILAQLDQLERAKGSGEFLTAYQKFTAAAAMYMTIFGPFVPALTQMLTGR